MIYQAADDDTAIDQSDIIEGCPILTIKQFSLDTLDAPQINVTISRVLVLTQTCDLANRKTSMVTVAVVHDAQFLVDHGLLKPADIRAPIVRKGPSIQAVGDLYQPRKRANLRKDNTLGWISRIQAQMIVHPHRSPNEIYGI